MNEVSVPNPVMHRIRSYLVDMRSRGWTHLVFSVVSSTHMGEPYLTTSFKNALHRLLVSRHSSNINEFIIVGVITEEGFKSLEKVSVEDAYKEAAAQGMLNYRGGMRPYDDLFQGSVRGVMIVGDLEKGDLSRSTYTNVFRDEDDVFINALYRLKENQDIRVEDGFRLDISIENRGCRSIERSIHSLEDFYREVEKKRIY